MQTHHSISPSVHHTKKSFWTATLSCALLSFVLIGCVTPPPAKLTFPTNGQTPPPGKSLVVIHRPGVLAGWMYSTDVWDGNNLIAEMGNAQSIAYVCEPGKHYFFNRSVEILGSVEADLLPNETYGLWLDIGGIWIPSFKLQPITLKNKRWWGAMDHVQKDNKWVTRSEKSAAKEAKWREEIPPILDSIISGKRKKETQLLGAEDHL